MMTPAELCHELMAPETDAPIVEARDREIRAAALRDFGARLWKRAGDLEEADDGDELVMGLESAAMEAEAAAMEIEEDREEPDAPPEDHDPNACPGCGGNCATACR